MLVRTLIALSFLAAGEAAACGVASDCELAVPASGGERVYRIDKREGQTGALVFAHGYKGSAAGVMRNSALRNVIAKQGFAFVAAEALGNWSLPNGPRPLRFDEAPYFDALVDVLAERHGIERTRVVLAGFSAGGMVAWNMACARASLFAGFVPISGTYWKAPPESCPGPAPNIVHIHGTSDRTVPMNGRPIGPTVQGKVMEAIAHMSRKADYDGDTRRSIGKLSCSVRRNGDGRVMELCLHPGGHSLPAEFVGAGLSELRRLTGLD